MIFVFLLFLLGANVASAESLNDQILAKRDGDASLSVLIASEVNINAIQEDGFTPLTFASRLCRPKTAQLETVAKQFGLRNLSLGERIFRKK